MIPKAIDLFAGPGGLSLGLKEAGFDIVAAVEMDPDAGSTYRHNIGNHTEIEDITKFRPKTLRRKLEKSGILAPGENISLIAGGPPCPGFSLIGRSKIMDLIKKGEYGNSKDPRHAFIDDPRNHLFLEFVRYVKEFKPNYFIMENVSGMSSYQIEDDPIVEVIKRKFGRNYIVEEEILNAADFGVPQDRKRIIFMGYRRGVQPCNFPMPGESSSRLSTLDAIHDFLGVEPTKNGRVKVNDKGRARRGLEFRRMMRRWETVRPDGSRISSTNGLKTSHWTRSVNDRDKILFTYIKSGAPSLKLGDVEFPASEPRQIYGDIFPVMWDTDLVPAFERSGMRAWKYRRYYVEANSGKKWLMYEQKGFKDKMRRIRWDRPAPTVVAHLAKDGYMFIHPLFDRTITVREAARFQSFPDSFEFQGSMTSQFRQVGNAVPPVLARELGTAIMQAMKLH